MTQLQDYEIKVLNLNLPKMKIKKLMQIFPLKKMKVGFFHWLFPRSLPKKDDTCDGSCVAASGAALWTPII